MTHQTEHSLIAMAAIIVMALNAGFAIASNQFHAVAGWMMCIWFAACFYFERRKTIEAGKP